MAGKKENKTNPEYPKVHTCWGQLQWGEETHNHSISWSSNHIQAHHLWGETWILEAALPPPCSDGSFLEREIQIVWWNNYDLELREENGAYEVGFK